MRSKAAEPGFGWDGSLAFRQTAPARSNVANIEVIFVFIGFLFCCCRTFTNTTNGEGREGHLDVWEIFQGGEGADRGQGTQVGCLVKWKVKN